MKLPIKTEPKSLAVSHWTEVEPFLDNSRAVLIHRHRRNHEGNTMSELPPLARYALSIEANTGYSATTEGECTPEQYGSAIAALAAPTAPTEALFLLHAGQIDSGGEQDDWDVEAYSGKAVEEFCRKYPGQTIKLYAGPQPAQAQRSVWEWKDHDTAKLVNDLRDIAVTYAGAQQLRERIAHAVRPLTDKLDAQKGTT